MNGYAGPLTGAVAVAAAAVAASIEDIADKPPALIALAIALIPGLAVFGRELGGALDTLGARPWFRNFAGKELTWRECGGIAGVLLGLISLAVIVVSALT
jgi:hypothetical protein